jgi:hypothetical protein
MAHINTRGFPSRWSWFDDNTPPRNTRYRLTFDIKMRGKNRASQVRRAASRHNVLRACQSGKPSSRSGGSSSTSPRCGRGARGPRPWVCDQCYRAKRKVIASHEIADRVVHGNQQTIRDRRNSVDLRTMSKQKPAVHKEPNTVFGYPS